MFSIAEVECLGSCGTAPMLQVNNEPFLREPEAEDVPGILDKLSKSSRGGEALMAAVVRYLLPPDGQNWSKLADSKKNGGYAAAENALKSMKPEDIGTAVKASGLRGRGGAGFAAGLKWSFLPNDGRRPRYIACNGDESEAGTYKDRQIIERNPHQLIEGLLIAARANTIDAADGTCAASTTPASTTCARAIAEVKEAGYLGKNILGSGLDLRSTLPR